MLAKTSQHGICTVVHSDPLHSCQDLKLLQSPTRTRDASIDSSPRTAERYSLVVFYESSDFEATSAQTKTAKRAMPEEGRDQQCHDDGDHTSGDWAVDAVEYYRRFE